MGHASNIVANIQPGDPLAFFNIPLVAKNGSFDAPCPTCQQHGQWNTELDTVSMRCKRAACDTCLGAGWIETGDDARPIHDIIMTPEGYPKWVIRYAPFRN